MTAKDFVYIYDRKMMMKLKSKGFRFIICAFHEVSQKKFWMFEKTEELTVALSSLSK